MKNLKKTLALMLTVFTVLLLLAACSTGEGRDDSDEKEKTNETYNEGVETEVGEQTGDEVVDTPVAIPMDEQIERYNNYLINGGFQYIEENLEPYELYLENGFEDFAISSYVEDTDNDGIYEVLLYMKDDRLQSAYAFLDTVNDEVVCIKTACHGGGSAGGAYMFLTTDTETGERVAVYSEGIRMGVAEQHSTCCVYAGTEHTEFANYRTTRYVGQETEAAKIREETDLYVENDEVFTFFKINGEYVSEEDYNALSGRFVNDYDTEMTDGSYEVPIVVNDIA